MTFAYSTMPMRGEEVQALLHVQCHSPSRAGLNVCRDTATIKVKCATNQVAQQPKLTYSSALCALGFIVGGSAMMAFIVKILTCF